jgi:hypothetical protein
MLYKENLVFNLPTYLVRLIFFFDCRTLVKSPDATANLLHHVESILELDFDRWPGGHLGSLLHITY